MFASTVADNHLHFTWLQLKGAASATMYWKSSSRKRSQPLTVAGTIAVPSKKLASATSAAKLGATRYWKSSSKIRWQPLTVADTLPGTVEATHPPAKLGATHPP